MCESILFLCVPIGNNVKANPWHITNATMCVCVWYCSIQWIEVIEPDNVKRFWSILFCSAFFCRSIHLKKTESFTSFFFKKNSKLLIFDFENFNLNFTYKIVGYILKDQFVRLSVMSQRWRCRSIYNQIRLCEWPHAFQYHNPNAMGMNLLNDFKRWMTMPNWFLGVQMSFSITLPFNRFRCK